jgi:hypothetical protein
MQICELKAVNLKGSPLFLAECGGAYLNNGQLLWVKANIADRMVKQYRPLLVNVSEKEVEKLKGGHYEIRSNTEVEDKDPPKKKQAEATEQTVESKSKNKSMAGKGRKRRK